ncbi:hypothetical protein [Deinococcus seoulensis]|nr:hypothetical protein [Deinococcus seoulensis]
MDVRDLTPVEIADLLDTAWRADQGEDADGPDVQTRAEIADRLGCDEDLRAEVWAAWRDELIADGRSVDDAEYWLDVVFVQLCPEDIPDPGARAVRRAAP